MKKLLLSALFFTSFIAYSQTGNVGINTTDPKTTLDITGQPSVASKADGILVPRMKRSELIAKVAASTYTAAAHNGTLIFITDIDGTTTAATAGITTANSFYYLEASTWKPFVGSSSTGGDTTNDAFINDPINTRVYLSTNSDGSPRSIVSQTGVVFQDDGKVGLGTLSPNYKVDVVSDTTAYLKLANADDSKSFSVLANPMSNNLQMGPTSANTELAITSGGVQTLFVENGQRVSVGAYGADKTSVLDIKANDKGILIPRINLTSNTLDLNGDGDNSVANQAVGLLVFNSGTVLPKGFYYWNGTEWRSIDNSSAVAPGVITINCNGSVLNPKSYTSGTPFTGTLTVPYTGGNGGTYSAGPVQTVNGLNFTLQGGKLNSGSGVLVFNVTGTPTVSSPTTTTVQINNTYAPLLLASQSCSTTVGNSSNAEIIEVAVMGPLRYLPDPQAGYGIDATSPDGKYSIRVWDIYNGIPGNVSVQIRPNTTTASLSWNFDTKYTGNGLIVQALNVGVFPATALGKWCGSGNGANNFVIQPSSGFVNAWGDFGIADGAAVEHRRYTWTNVDSADKTMYQAEIMMGLANGTSNMNFSTCPSGNCNFTKAYIKITQISAN